MRRTWRGWGVGLAAVGLVGGFPAAGWAAGVGMPPLTPRAAEAAVFDPVSQQLLLARNADHPVPVASLVKLMTARLALEAGNLDRPVVVPMGVTALPETKVGLVPGDEVPMRVLLSAMMVRSGNDAAYSVAAAIGGSEAGFAQEMNAEAARLGLRDTHYVNSSGLDAPGQYSSAADVARLAAADLALPGFPALVTQRSVTVQGRGYGTVNPFLAYYPGASGIKTGFTDSAMFCLAASAARGGRTLIAVVLHEPDWSSADTDAAALLDWGFGQIPGDRPASAGSAAAPATPGSPPGPFVQPPAVPPASAAIPAVLARPDAAASLRSGRTAVTPKRASSLPWVAAGAVVAALAGALGFFLTRR